MDEPTQDQHASSPEGYAEQVERSVNVRTAMPSIVYRNLPLVIRVDVSHIGPLPNIPEGVKTVDDLMKLPPEQVEEIHRQIGLARARFLTFSPFTQHPLPISVRIVNAEGEEIIEHQNISQLAIVTDDPGRTRFYSYRPTILVTTGETKTWLLDLTPRLASLERSTHSLSVRMHAHRELYWESSPESFEVKSLPGAVTDLLKTVVPMKQAAEDEEAMFDWLSPDIDPHLLHTLLPPDIWENVAFHLLIGRGLAAHEGTDITPEFVRLLPTWVRPLADVVRHELLLQSDDRQAADALREDFAKRHPEFEWLMERAVAGDGLIAQARALSP